jgi:large subunit ribosomal protein L17
MASNLIIHERIRTTLGKARSLVYLMNNLFKKIAPMNIPAQRKAATIVRIPLAYKKLMNGLVDKYRHNIGGVVRIIKDPKARLNDNSKMAYVEFLDK